jgi:hypothetical protein
MILPPANSAGSRSGPGYPGRVKPTTTWSPGGAAGRSRTGRGCRGRASARSSRRCSGTCSSKPPMASGCLTCSSSCPSNAEPHDPSGAAAEVGRVGPWLSRRPNDRCPRPHRDPASDRGIASCCVYRRPPRPWVPAARLPGPRAACARAQGAVRAWRRGWSGERDAMVRRPLCRARYLSEIALLGSVVPPRIRDDEAYPSLPYQPP